MLQMQLNFFLLFQENQEQQSRTDTLFLQSDKLDTTRYLVSSIVNFVYTSTLNKAFDTIIRNVFELLQHFISDEY